MIKLIFVFQELWSWIGMCVDWRSLGEGVIVQSIPRIAQKHGLRVNLLKESELYGLSLKDLTVALEDYEVVLRRLFLEFGVSWKDIYSTSDIGAERLLLAEMMDLTGDDAVLDVGCGRGYFTAAAAAHTNSVTGLDLMDRLGRKGWWLRFVSTMQELGLKDKILEIRGSGAAMPFKSKSFSIAASVHAIRNFADEFTIQLALKEMRRVTMKGGRVIVVESLPLTTTQAQIAHLKMYNCKVKYSKGDMYYWNEEKLKSLFEKAGLKRYETKTIDPKLSATPPLFILNLLNLPEPEREQADEEYRDAVEAVRKWGEASPPSLMIEAAAE